MWNFPDIGVHMPHTSRRQLGGFTRVTLLMLQMRLDFVVRGRNMGKTRGRPE